MPRIGQHQHHLTNINEIKKDLKESHVMLQIALYSNHSLPVDFCTEKDYVNILLQLHRVLGGSYWTKKRSLFLLHLPMSQESTPQHKVPNTKSVGQAQGN
jgi:hypothetical protein